MSGVVRPLPRATYRLQLNRDFTFGAAEALVPYLDRLGVSHAYLSPILAARSGSTHGYDTIDHTRLNPELGTLDDFRSLARALQARGMSILLDIVPNHMGVGGDGNALWLDLLEWGRESRYADWFDVDWSPGQSSLAGRVLVPFLGSSYAQALAEGRLELRFERNEGSFAVWAEGAHRLPLALRDYAMLLPEGWHDSVAATAAGAPAFKRRLAAACIADGALATGLAAAVDAINAEPGRQRLGALIERQNWRAARYSVAADDINYRRFFTNADLAGIRVEREDVFDHVHQLTFQLVDEGLVEGLRIDHIDGLYDPKAYCQRLRDKCPRPIYLVVEKILAPHEALRADWDVEGTTGYEFAGAVTRLLTEPEAEATLSRTYAAVTGQTTTFEEVERAAKLGIMEVEMGAELDALARRLVRLAADAAAADLTHGTLRRALRATIGELNVYRTYIDADGATAADRRLLGRAIARARRTLLSADPAVFDFLAPTLAGETGRAARDLAARVQQYAGPVMAKGLEDTALYRFNRLIALNDVGARPDRFSMSVAAFHDFLRGRVRVQPAGMLNGSSHDSKRGEDTRARIAAISGHVGPWTDAVDDWHGLLRGAGAPEIDRNDSYHFFQLLVGAWPAALEPGLDLTDADLAPLRDRLEAAMLKSVREARVHSNWNAPQADYEDRVLAYVRQALRGDPANRFLASFRAFEDRIATDGAANGIVATVLRLTVPGVPDIYRGAELWEQSMVDPDNRRAVDFDERRRLLDAVEVADLGVLARRPRSGMAKIAVISRLLALRRALPALFAQGSYEPLVLGGADSDRVLGFVRRHEEHVLVVLAALQPWRAPPVVALEGTEPGEDCIEVLRRRRATVADAIALLGDGVPAAVLHGRGRPRS